MERTIEEIRNIIKLKKTGKRKKDESKWMKFKCDSCDKECEILISKYKLRTNHYCSYDCYRNHHKKI